MANLTISMDDSLIRAARVQAIQQGTSLSAKIRDFVVHYVATGANAPTNAPVQLPVFSGGSGLAPGIDPCSNKSYREAMGD
jgi:plasmid stability protein